MVRFLKTPGIQYPTKELATKFSQENYDRRPDFSSFGIHQANYFNEAIIRWCPEIREAREGCVAIHNYQEEWNKQD